MAQDMNKVILIGNVVKDIELRSANGTPTASFTIAVNGPKGQDGTSHADFPTVTVWRKTAEICAQYLHKGSKIAVEGRLHTRSYEKNGQKVFITEVAAENVQFLTPKNSTGNATAKGGDPEQFTEVDDEELPF